jgi:small subunit ribosomal protein S5
VERQTVITLRGADKQVLGEAASRIRALRPPEPYKGKGIKYQEEVIQRKAGKAVGGAGVRAVVEASGIQNVLTKCIGSNNPHNMVKASFEALKKLKSPEEIASLRGKSLAEIR